MVGCGRSTPDFGRSKCGDDLKPDWLDIKTEYVTTTISTRELAKKREVPYGTLRLRSEKEGWVELRKEYQRTTSAKIVQNVSDSVSAEKASYITNLLESADVASRVVYDALTSIGYKFITKPKDIKDLVDAIKVIHDLSESANENDGVPEDDGLTAALIAATSEVCSGEDDSNLLPEEETDEE